MTNPKERTRATVGARTFLCVLRDLGEPVDMRLVRTLATSLLRHFPTDDDLLQSHLGLPNIWSNPAADEQGSLGVDSAKLVYSDDSEKLAIAVAGEIQRQSGHSHRIACAKAFLRDAAHEELSSSSRLKCTWETIYLCCCDATASKGWALATDSHPDLAIVNIGMSVLRMSSREQREVLSLYEWEISWMATPEPFPIKDAIELSTKVLEAAIAVTDQ
jgi:hypothetical protein